MDLVLATAIITTAIYCLIPAIIVIKLNKKYLAFFPVAVLISLVLSTTVYISITPYIVCSYVGIVTYMQYRQKVLATFTAAMCYSVSLLSDTLTGIFFISVLKKDLDTYFISTQRLLYFSISLLSIELILCFILNIIVNKNIKIKELELARKTENIIALYLVFSLLCCIFGFIVGKITNLNIFSLLFICVINIIFLIITPLLFLYVAKSTIWENKYKMIEALQEQSELFSGEIAATSIKNNKVMHNIRAVFSSFDLYFKYENYKELKEYYYRDVVEIKDDLSSDNDKMYQLKDIVLLNMRSILLRKMIEAEKKHVKLNIDVDGVIRDTFISGKDMVEIIGILLDNAIESCTGTENEVNCSIEELEDGLYFNVKNKFIQEVDENKMHKYGFSTKGKGRGIGLNRIKDDLCKKYNNKQLLMMTKKTNGIFDVTIITGSM